MNATVLRFVTGRWILNAARPKSSFSFLQRVIRLISITEAIVSASLSIKILSHDGKIYIVVFILEAIMRDNLRNQNDDKILSSLCD